MGLESAGEEGDLKGRVPGLGELWAWEVTDKSVDR